MNQSKLLYLLTLFFFISCDPNALLDDVSDDVQLPTTLNIRLTDGPVELDEVNIDLQEVLIKGPGGFEEIPLDANAGIYDLLDLQNGIDVLIASAEVELPRITEVRLVLGPNNTVVADGETFDLKIPSGNQSGLKIKLCLDLTDNPQYDLLLDFDAAASIHQTGNGKFIMKPVIHIMNADAKCQGDDDEDEEEDDENEEEEEVLPDNVAEWLNANYEGYEFESKTTAFCGAEVLEVKATKDQETIYLYFDADGNYLQSATIIDNTDLPEAVTAAIAADYPDYTLADGPTYRVELSDGTIWYRGRLETSDAKLNVVYQEDGTLYCDDKVSDEEDSGSEDEEEEDDEEDVQPGDLPQDVIDFVQENFPDYSFTGLSSGALCGGTEVYILKGSKGLLKAWLYFDLDWNFLQSAEPFQEKDLSAEIVAAIATDYSDYKIMNNQAWKITTASGEVQYRIYIKKNNSGDKMYVIYGADGAFICAEA